MSKTIQWNKRSTLSGLQQYLIEMPLLLFIVLFFLSAGYLLLTKIESTDLWWHLSCGRYFFENGFYPPLGTFTFSPVSQSTANSYTWLGDLFLYCIHHFFGGETGLQIFRIIVSCIPVYIFIRLSNKNYNTWTLLGALSIVMGTYQQNLLRNSIFAMIFLPLMVWLWHIAVKRRNLKWLLLFPVIMLLWTHMHGYAIVGLCILALFSAGEVIDQTIKKENRNIRFLLVLLIVLSCSWKIVQVNWNVDLLSIKNNLQASLNQNSDSEATPSKTLIQKSDILQKNKQATEQSKTRSRRLINFVQKVFRPFLKGGDTDIVMEYKSPFEAYAILPSKVLFLFSIFYLIYLIWGITYDRNGLKASYILPSLASLFLGLGYVRTLAFPFLVAFPFMAAHLADFFSQFRENENHFGKFIRNVIPPLGGIIYYDRYFRFYRILFWGVPLIICIQFALTAHYNYKQKTFYKITQILTREPGIGRNNLFRNTLPDYVLTKYCNENIFNSYGMGGYLIWKWYNKKKVFIDSRSITYQKDFYEDYNNNYSFRYLDSLGINKALLNIIRDEGLYHAYMSRNWCLLAFDISTILLQRPTDKGLESTYGVIPVFMGKSDDLELLPKLELHSFGALINNVLRYMLLFGRLSDAIEWSKNIQNIIEKLPLDMQQGIQEKKLFMDMIEMHFGRINSPVLAILCQQIEKDDQPASVACAIGDAYLRLFQQKKARNQYLKAAQIHPESIDLQQQIGDRFFQMNMRDQAISQYKKVISLNPDAIDTYMQLSYLMAEQKAYDQSEKYLRILLEKAPREPLVYLNLGMVLAAEGKKDEAIEIYQKGLVSFPENKRLKEESDKILHQNW